MLQRFYINLTPELNHKIERKAQVARKPKAEIARQALEIGLQQIGPAEPNSAQALLNFVKMIEKIPAKGKIPKDAVENMDYYTWGGNKRK